MSSRLTQADAARLMYAHAKAVRSAEAAVDAGLTKPMGVPVDFAAVRNGAKAAEAAFAELVAEMAEDENA